MIRSRTFALLLLLAGVGCRGSASADDGPETSENPKETVFDLSDGLLPDGVPEALSKAVRARRGDMPKPELMRMRSEGGKVVAPAEDGARAELTVDADLQRQTMAVMRRYAIPEASVVLMEAKTGKVLVYASYLHEKPLRDLAVLAGSPSASVFKIVTGSALVSEANVDPESSHCYSGGQHSLTELDLTADPKRDTACASLSSAMGRSINTVFARLARAELPPATLERVARKLHYGTPLAFDVPVETSQLAFPDDALGYARTAAGFWNTTLSPLHAAWISAAIVNDGMAVRPHVVARVESADGTEVYAAPNEPERSQVLAPADAGKVATMMRATVTGGTATRAFRDDAGRPFLPSLAVAGKTGTLTDSAKQRYYTWFTGFGPSAGTASPVAVAALVVNGAVWRVKANVLAREVLRAYYAKHDVAGVTRPQLTDGAPSPSKAKPAAARATDKKDVATRTRTKSRAVASRR